MMKLKIGGVPYKLPGSDSGGPPFAAVEIEVDSGKLRLLMQEDGNWRVYQVSKRDGSAMELALGLVTDKVVVTVPKTAQSRINKLQTQLGDLMSHIDVAIEHVTKGDGSKVQLNCKCGGHMFSKYSDRYSCASFQRTLAKARCLIRM